MQFSKSAIATLFAGVASLASAQYGSPSMSMSMGMDATPTGSAQPSGSVKVWVVKVGDENDPKVLKFQPNNLQAAPGDMIQFHFANGNHSVVQSNFANPCVPMPMASDSKMMPFFSGYMPIGDKAKTIGMPAFTIMVQDTKPIWFYCSQGKHCENGMVGSVNAPTSGNTLDAYTQKAKSVSQSQAPASAEGGSNSSNTTSGSTTMTTATSTSGGSSYGAGASASGSIAPSATLAAGIPSASIPKLTVLFGALAAAVFLA